mmetsp:Transcript_16083/g.41333  ORF Transcript_16083/g.41333 Transcript_16083/m.41333 type:complete len:133 (+) Transcript_16083:186-584(+)
MGPTVEMIAVHKEYRGQGLLPLLWDRIRRFIEEKVALECMNEMTSPGNMMIKATQLTNAIIDEHNGRVTTDKEFFFTYAGFSVQEQKSMMAGLMSGNRPIDEEAVLFAPLLTEDQVKSRLTEQPAMAGWKIN